MVTSFELDAADRGQCRREQAALQGTVELVDSASVALGPVTLESLAVIQQRARQRLRALIGDRSEEAHVVL